jgi:hypothetical protein
MAERMARGQARIQLKYKDQKSWQDFVDRLRQHSAPGMSNTIAHSQALRPSLHDLHDQLSAVTIPVLLAVGDEDARCLETNLMLKSVLPKAGLWICPNTGHAIDLEEPAPFNSQVESLLSAVERGSWRRGYLGAGLDSSQRLQRRISSDNSRRPQSGNARTGFRDAADRRYQSQMTLTCSPVTRRRVCQSQEYLLCFNGAFGSR